LSITPRPEVGWHLIDQFVEGVVGITTPTYAGTYRSIAISREFWRIFATS
jgi:hypothetical protein